MKKTALTAAAVALALALAGCGPETGAESTERASAPESAGLQEAYDASWEAKKLAEERLKKRYEKKGVDEYSIEETAVGFSTRDPEVCFVGFRVTLGGKTEYYGYRFKKEKGALRLIDEGREIGKNAVESGAKED